MIIEVVTILSLFIGGSAFVRLFGLRDWGLPILGFIAGICMFIIFGTVQALTPITTSPYLTISLTLFIPLVAWTYFVLRGDDVKVNPHTALTIVLALILAVVFFREANLVNWHVDSFRYIMVGSLIADGNYTNLPIDLIEKRMLSIPLLHASANLSENGWYLRSFTPLLALSTLGLIAWMSWRGLRQRMDTRSIIIFSAAGLLLLATTNRFVFHTFYINGHLLFGALLLLIVGCFWLFGLNKQYRSDPALAALPLLAIPPLVVTRPEAFLVVLFALLPILLSGVVTSRYKAALLGVLGISIIAWQGFVVSAYLERGSGLPITAYVPILLGIVILSLIPVTWYWKQLSKYSKVLLTLAESGLWLGVALLAIREPNLLWWSVGATVENVAMGGGSWGVSFIILLVIFVGLLFFIKAPFQTYLRFPITTFLPLAFLLALIQGGVYRVGDGDSLNRMWMQFIPLAVLYIIVAMAAGQWRFKRSDIKKLKQKLLPRKKTRPSRA